MTIALAQRFVGLGHKIRAGQSRSQKHQQHDSTMTEACRSYATTTTTSTAPNTTPDDDEAMMLVMTVSVSPASSSSEGLRDGVPTTPLVLTEVSSSLPPAPLAFDECNYVVGDQLCQLVQSEAAYVVTPSPPCIRHLNTEPEYPIAEWTRRMAQWCFRVVDHFDLDRETVAVAINFLQRYLATLAQQAPLRDDDDDDDHVSASACPCWSCQRIIESHDFQRVAMTCLYVAIKMQADPAVVDGSNSYHRQPFDLNHFVHLSRGQFARDDIVRTEQALLPALSWQLCPPTPALFVSYFLTTVWPAATSHHQQTCQDVLVLHVVRELSRYLTELSICLRHVTGTPSQMALASILVSMDLLHARALPRADRRSFCRAVWAVMHWKNVDPTIAVLATLRRQLHAAVGPELVVPAPSVVVVPPPQKSPTSTVLCAATMSATADGHNKQVVGTEQEHHVEATLQGHPIYVARQYALFDHAMLCPASSPPPDAFVTPSYCDER